MTDFLLDTNTLSELERPHPSPNVRDFIRYTPLDRLYVSDVVIAEIRFGIDNSQSSVRRDKLATWLSAIIRPMFASRILPVTEDILLRWRWLLETGRRDGYTFEQSDALIAATAAHHGLTVLTRDVEPFKRAEVRYLDPWQRQ